MFDRYVQQTQPNWKRRAVIIASLALHGVAAIVLVVWSFFHVDEIAPPAVSLTFFSAPPPPPPPPPPAKKKSTETKKITPVEHKIVNPTQVNPIIQPKQEEDKKDDSSDDDGVEGGEEGGVKGGVVGGVKGGVVGGTLGGVPGGTGTGTAPKTVAGFTLIRDQLSHPTPQLPDWFKNQHAHQVVQGTYKVCLDNSGRVMSTAIVNAIGGVDDGVMSQIRSGWTYKPQPVPVCFVAMVKFQIN